MSDSTLAALTAATASTGGLFYGTQGGADRKFTLTSAGAALAEAANAAAQITALGLGTIATQAASAVAITGGTITGLTQLTLTAAGITNTFTSLATTPTAGFSLINSTAAAAGAQQVSPSLVFTGQGWKTTATAASQQVDFRLYGLPVQGAAAPTGRLTLGAQVNGGGFTDLLAFNSAAGSSSVASIGDSSLSGGIGFFNSSLTLFSFGSLVAYVNNARFELENSTPLAFSSSSAVNNATVFLHLDASAVLAQRNSTNAQEFRCYNTYTSSTSHEFGKLEWASNVFRVGTEKGSGGGTARALALVTDDTNRINIGASGELGFFGATAIAKPTVSGSRALPEQALADLLTELANLGLITDSTTV